VESKNSTVNWEYGKASLLVNVTDKENEDQPRDKNEKFYSRKRHPPPVYDEQGPSAYSKYISNYWVFRGITFKR